MLDSAELNFRDSRSWSPAQISKFSTKLASFKHLWLLSMSCTSATAALLATLFRATPRVTQLNANDILIRCKNLFEAPNCDNTQCTDILPMLDTLVLEVGNVTVIKCDPNDFVRNVLKPRVAEYTLTTHPERRRLRKIIVYGKEESRIDNEHPFIAVLRAWASEGHIEFQKRVVEYRRECYYWLDPDPGLQDWPEIFVE